MKKNGFTLVEILVVVALIAIVVMISVSAFNNHMLESRMVACLAEMEKVNEATEILAVQQKGKAPTIEQIEAEWGKPINRHFHYIPNAEDSNMGHGNDLDFCDESNPGVSIENRDCLDIDWIWVCDHDHGDLAEFNFAVDNSQQFAMPWDKTAPAPAFMKDVKYWQGIWFDRVAFMNWEAKK